MGYQEVVEREIEGSREFRCNKLYLYWNIKIVSTNILAGGPWITYSLLRSQRPKNQGLFPTGVRDFYFFRNLQTGSGAQLASCSVDTEMSFT